jgi:hypothetical protein
LGITGRQVSKARRRGYFVTREEGGKITKTSFTPPAAANVQTPKTGPKEGDKKNKKRNHQKGNN